MKKSRIFHITFPAAWAASIEAECEAKHYTIAEYFKEMYRNHREEQELKRDLFLYESDKEHMTTRTVDSIVRLIPKS